ncbi:MAG TPA: hypothetical protein PKO33_00075, partial [Pyrinomonadaceae bacterium]|nr:hypothetical protein [Pyrinomonadaceae bacterium]
MTNSRERYYEQAARHSGLLAPSLREVDYIDTEPRDIVVQIELIEYFERVKRLKADRFQRDLARRLQDAVVNRKTKRTLAAIHAEAQLGKTTLISQTFPAWIMGHDPLFRFALAMYNVTQSQKHGVVVMLLMNSQIHKDIFPNRDGWIHSENKEGWMTNARREFGDGQFSFNPVGLQSGLTGSGFDHLGIDDPYKEAKEAFSPVINESLRNFFDYTVQSRLGMYSNITGMFHRYAYEDLAGYLLDTGDFEYWRYASVCDGDYIHDKTGRRFVDPLGRTEGELVSPERRPWKYYEKKQRNKRVWNSMFQGRPSSEEGDFFNVGKIRVIDRETAERRRQECVALVRSWDQAATAGGGDFTVGALLGIRPDGGVTVFHVWRDQVDSAAKLNKQVKLAASDGPEVAITVPDDPGAAGTHVVWHTQQELAGFTVVGMPTTGSKELRATNLSVAVNDGLVEFADDAELHEDEQWNDVVKTELRNFPLSEFKDVVDAMSDGYNYLYGIARKGLVVQHFKPQRNLISADVFERRVMRRDGDGFIPSAWTIYAAVKLSPDASRPTAGVIVARGSQNSPFAEDLFVLAEYKAWNADFERVFEWIGRRRAELFPNAPVTVWAHPDSKAVLDTVNRKLPFGVTLFDGDVFAGLTELGWYLKPTQFAHPFNTFGTEPAAHLYFLVPGDQMDAPVKPELPEDDWGFYYARQEARTWTFDDKGKPNAVGGVLDCLRIVT